MACEGWEGLVDVFFSVVITFCPSMYIGYSRPSSAATFLRASSMRVLFSAREKSMKGSFRNSDTCGFVSAVAMVTSPSQCLASILLRASGTRQGEHSLRIENTLEGEDPAERSLKRQDWPDSIHAKCAKAIYSNTSATTSAGSRWRSTRCWRGCWG